MCIIWHIIHIHQDRGHAHQHRNRRQTDGSGPEAHRPPDQASGGGRGAAADGQASQASPGAEVAQGLGLGRRPRRDAPGPIVASVVILVDSSVWIAHLRGSLTPATAKLEAAVTTEPILVGDLILLEVLQGARDELAAARIERGLRRFEVVPLLDADLAPRAARNYRRLRDMGITIRKTNDIIIGTFCIERGYSLLHDDRDFVAMEEHLGLVAA